MISPCASGCGDYVFDCYGPECEACAEAVHEHAQEPPQPMPFPHPEHLTYTSCDDGVWLVCDHLIECGWRHNLGFSARPMDVMHAQRLHRIAQGSVAG